MSLTRAISVAFLAISMTIWAMCIVVTGLWLAIDGSARWSALRGACLILGVAAIAGGSFLFMASTADRLFPRASQGIAIWLFEMAMFMVFLVSFIWGVLAYGGGLR